MTHPAHVVMHTSYHHAHLTLLVCILFRMRVSAHANIMLAFMFHATLTCILTRRIWPGLLVGGDRRPGMGLLGLHKLPR